MCRHSTSDVRSWSKASMNSRLISRFGSRSSLRKFHRTCFLGVYIKQDLLQLEVQFKASLVGCTSHPFFIHFFNFSRSHPIWFIHGSIYNLGKFLFLSTYQRKKKTTTSTTKKKSKQNRRKCPDVPFRPGQRDHSSRVCCSHQSHFGIKVALCASKNLLLLTFCDPS